MLPIFFEADPYSLLKNSNQYRYFIVLFYDKKSNISFRKNLRKDYPIFHTTTGKNTCVIDFDFPPRDWLKNYLTWFLKQYENEKLEVNDFNSLEYLKEFGIDAYDEMRNCYEAYDVGSFSQNVQLKLMHMYDLSASSLPSVLVFDSQDNINYGIKQNLNIHALHSIGKKLGYGEKLENLDEVEIRKSRHNKNPIEIFDILRKPYSQAFNDVIDMIAANQSNLQDTQSSIITLQEKYSEFRNLEFPNKFRWKPSLEKYIQRHRDFLNVFIALKTL